MADLYPVYIALRDLMLKAAPGLSIAKDAAGEFTANVPDHIMATRDPVWFGSVRLTQNHVGYYLPPLAMKEGRDVVVSEGLRHMAQGKTCFIFHDANPARLAELEQVTRQVASRFKAWAA